MANSDYTFSQVLAGTGYFSRSGDTGFSQGVKDMQQYLKDIGYDIDVDGRFGPGCESCVKEFQRELGITPDGSAGPKTITRLNTVRSSSYYTKYGRRLESSEWGRDNILAGKFDTDNDTKIDMLARIIYAEHTSNTDDQKGVAIVIKNRTGNSNYYQSGYTNTSIWARVVGMKTPTIQYGSAASTSTNAKTPMRGYGGNESNGYVDPGWKHAVDCATKLINGQSISVSGYLVNGKSVSSTRKDVTNQLNQFGWEHYCQFFDDKTIDTSVNCITFSRSGSNVVCTYKR